ncbi:LysM peptidoglycan-binding domain-containing protein [Patiriisocius sp. Uisw_047]|uniref:lytic transglycosylase domain-containing protein n=1 Tax=Patiriisocius sp. Uisw_047 TaxID=3230969 RepID=UPI0039EB0766
MKNLLLFGCCLASLSSLAQSPIIIESLPDASRQHVADSLKVGSIIKIEKNVLVDDDTIISVIPDSQIIIPATIAIGTPEFTLADMAQARKIDSLWLAELYSSDRFEEMYGAIEQQTYVPIAYEELPTDTLKQRLKELDARTPFTVEYNPQLESVIKNYLKNRRTAMGRLIALSDYYFPMFEETLDRHNLPLEMKYLAIVESALNPRAQSRVGATGLWQFMFSTGKMFGLDVNSYVDERSDPILATDAASKYLNSLYKSLGDWDLALAAYNSGPGNVAKAIRRSGGYKNYWNIRPHLPRETAGYVPAFLATMYIFEFADEHGFTSNGPRYPFITTDTIHIKKQISFDQIATVTNLPIEEIEFLNPSYKLGVIPYLKDEQYYLRLPIDQMGTFVHNEDAVYAYAQVEFDKKEKPLPTLTDQSTQVRYRVKSGDYLGKIADKYGVSIRNIKRWNNMRSNNLKIGQRLTIHPRKIPASAKSSSSKPKKVIDSNGKTVYSVANGDSLWSIAQKFDGATVEKIKKWNDISSNNLKVGMKLIVSE